MWAALPASVLLRWAGCGVRWGKNGGFPFFFFFVSYLETNLIKFIHYNFVAFE